MRISVQVMEQGSNLNTCSFLPLPVFGRQLLAPFRRERGFLPTFLPTRLNAILAHRVQDPVLPDLHPVQFDGLLPGYAQPIAFELLGLVSGVSLGNSSS